MKDGEMERRKTKISLHRPFFTSTEGGKKNQYVGIAVFVCMQARNKHQSRNIDTRGETSLLLQIYNIGVETDGKLSAD